MKSAEKPCDQFRHLFVKLVLNQNPRSEDIDLVNAFRINNPHLPATSTRTRSSNPFQRVKPSFKVSDVEERYDREKYVELASARERIDQ